MVSRREMLALGGASCTLIIGGCLESSPSSSDSTTPTENNQQTGQERITTENDQQIDQEKITAPGFPQVTLNWAYYHGDIIPENRGGEMSVATEDDAPERALNLNVVSMCANYNDQTYYEEYQTGYGAQQRLALAETSDVSLFDESDTVRFESTRQVDRYPNRWYLLENNDIIYALTHVGGLIGGGYILKEDYMDPKQTLIKQIEEEEKPEGGGIGQHPFEVLSAFETRYGHESLDLDTHDDLSIPMNELTPSRAEQLVVQNFDSVTESDVHIVSEREKEGYPVDSNESYFIAVDTGPLHHIEVTSWVDTDFATRYAQDRPRRYDWTFDAYPVETEIRESTLGPYRERATPDVNCGFVSDDGVQKLFLVHTGQRDDVKLVHDIYSGNITMMW